MMFELGRRLLQSSLSPILRLYTRDRGLGAPDKEALVIVPSNALTSEPSQDPTQAISRTAQTSSSIRSPFVTTS